MQSELFNHVWDDGVDTLREDGWEEAEGIGAGTPSSENEGKEEEDEEDERVKMGIGSAGELSRSLPISIPSSAFFSLRGVDLLEEYLDI